MKSLNNLALFGGYNSFIDEGIHLFLSGCVASMGYISGLDIKLSLITFLAGALLDIDHIFSKPIAKLIKAESYKGNIFHGSNGYTIKILHGFDLALIFGVAGFYITSSSIFGACLFLSLSLHEFWDFIVYPHTWWELLLITRASKNFKPGLRKNLIGIIFNNNSLKF